MPKYHQATTIALAISEVPPEERHELYREVSMELAMLHQNYQSSIFSLASALDKTSTDPLRLLASALKGALKDA